MASNLGGRNSSKTPFSIQINVFGVPKIRWVGLEIPGRAHLGWVDLEELGLMGSFIMVPV